MQFITKNEECQKKTAIYNILINQNKIDSFKIKQINDEFNKLQEAFSAK